MSPPVYTTEPTTFPWTFLICAGEAVQCGGFPWYPRDFRNWGGLISGKGVVGTLSPPLSSERACINISTIPSRNSWRNLPEKLFDPGEFPRNIFPNTGRLRNGLAAYMCSVPFTFCCFLNSACSVPGVRLFGYSSEYTPWGNDSHFLTAFHIRSGQELFLFLILLILF